MEATGISGSVAIVTGGSGGLGAGVVAALAARGARVVSLDLRPAPAGQAHRSHVVDVREEADVQAAVDSVVTELGRVDMLVNCHGVLQAFGPLTQTPDAEVRRVMSINFEGTVVTCRAVGRQLARQDGGGRIVNVASQAGKVPWPDIAIYGASKAAVIALSQALALELGPHGVTVNAVCPGVMRTEMTVGAFGSSAPAGASVDALLDEKGRSLPAGRLGTARDVGELVAWLVSPAAAFMTGATLNLTGGEQFF